MQTLLLKLGFVQLKMDFSIIDSNTVNHFQSFYVIKKIDLWYWHQCVVYMEIYAYFVENMHKIYNFPKKVIFSHPKISILVKKH